MVSEMHLSVLYGAMIIAPISEMYLVRERYRMSEIYRVSERYLCVLYGAMIMCAL